MSFNLNKNEDPGSSSKKTSFDLSKSDEKPNKKNYWLAAIVAVLFIGGIGWYLMQPGSIAKTAAKPEQANIVVPTADTAAGTLKLDTGTSVSAPVRLDTAAAIVVASFKAGSFTPQGNITSIVSQIRQKQNKGSALKISVFGYASSEGNISFNQSISQARADAYKKLLVVKGIADSVVTAVGRGIDHPVASNGTEAGRRKNRRVEVLF